MADIDPETVKRCIAVVENSVYLTREGTLDLLKALLPEPEKTEAEKLVEEWLNTSPFDHDDMIAFCQFVLDRVRPVAVISEDLHPAPVSDPQYVFGPWLPAVDGMTPPFPIGWVYQMRSTISGKIGDTVRHAGRRHPSSNTEYRVRFEVGKWYDWTGGACPVESGTKGAVRFRNGKEADSSTLSTWAWRHEHEDWQGDYEIIAFRITGDSQ